MLFTLYLGMQIYNDTAIQYNQELMAVMMNLSEEFLKGFGSFASIGTVGQPVMAI
jgi:hypothetical protein